MSDKSTGAIAKHNLAYFFEPETLSDLFDRIPYFIVEVYNRHRLHAAIQYSSSVNF